MSSDNWTKPRSVAVPDKEWRRWREKAKEKDISVSRYVRECVKAADQGEPKDGER